MAKKEVNKGSNVEMYRKRIGKQGYNMNKRMVKSLKDVADAKQSAFGIKDVALVFLAILVLLASVYALFYFAFDVDLE